jgi:hypothetical protein
MLLNAIIVAQQSVNQVVPSCHRCLKWPQSNTLCLKAALFSWLIHKAHMATYSATHMQDVDQTASTAMSQQAQTLSAIFVSLWAA